MTKVYTGASMSLDGYISGPAETGFEHLFKWSGNGDVVVPTTQPEMTLRMSAASAEHFRNIIDSTGALVVGPRLFDATDAWGGNHPMGRPRGGGHPQRARCVSHVLEGSGGQSPAPPPFAAALMYQQT